ncbi:hypothetical protein BMS3Abin02_02400 [bacterium BMS3Abin02]|nr:hypothetical protein BMS3Abin02_02400 [bacterium BMS3Abin02]
MDSRTTDDLEQTLLATEAVIARSRAVQIAVLAELDRHQVSTADGCRSMVEWTASRLDVAPETASALIRTSRAVLDTPEVAEALTAGEITFDRAVELCRYAATGVDNTVETGWRFDIGGLRREVSRRHRFSRDREHESVCDRYLAMQPNLDQTSWRLWGLLPGVDGQIVEQALIRRADTFPALPDGTRSTLGQRQADALTSIAQDSLTATAGEGTCTPPGHRVRRRRPGNPDSKQDRHHPRFGRSDRT